MGFCEWCNKNPASWEVIDDNSETGMAMVCRECYESVRMPKEDKTERISRIVELIEEEARSRTLPKDYVSRLYQVQMDVLKEVMEIMRKKREEERK